MASDVQTQLPPPIPRVQANVTPLYLILERQAIYVYKQLTDFIKTLASPGHSDVQNKKKFLELLVNIRENFVRLYVLSKWSRNSHSIQRLVDLFVWLREQNQSLSNSIMHLGSIKESLVRAKIPNPDLITALEVLTKGRPQLPLHDLLPEKPISSVTILKTLKDLNIELSTRMALQDDLPTPFYKYKVQNGRVTFNCTSFQASISIANESNTDDYELLSSSKDFFLVDYKLSFASKNNKLVPSITSLPLPVLFKIEQNSNAILAQSGLVGLYNLLHTYSITCKLYLIHRQLMDLRMGLWKGHIAHTYNAEKCIVIITYWLKKNCTLSTIEIGKVRKTDDLGFRWIKDGKLYTDHDLSLIDSNDVIDIETLIRSVIEKHIDLIISDTQKQLIEKIENAENLATIYSNADLENHTNTSLIINITHNKSVMFGIDKLSGNVYFQNPNPLMSQICQQINTDPKKTVVKLLSLRLETQLFELSSILYATGWVNAEAINLNNSTTQSSISKLNISYEALKDKSLANQLLTLKFYRRREWPSGWFLTVGVSGYSYNVQWWVSRIKSSAGQWSVTWAEPLEIKWKENQYDYQGSLDLVSIATSRLLSNMIIQELEDQGAKVKQLNRTLEQTRVFMKSTFGITLDDDTDKDPLVVINNESLCNIPNCHSALVLSVKTTGDEMELQLFGKLKTEFKSSVSFVDKSTSIDMNPNTSLFKIRSVVNTKAKFLQQPIHFLSDLIAVLNKLSGLLTLLQLINNDSNIKVTDVSLNNISFQYGLAKNETMSLILLDDEQTKLENKFISLKLPHDNPHIYCIDELRSLLNATAIKNDVYDMDIFMLSPKGVKIFIRYLKFTLPFFRAVDDILKERKSDLDKFIESKGFDDLQRSINSVPLSTYEVNYYGTTLLTIDYYRAFEKIDENLAKRKKKSIDKAMTKIVRGKVTLQVKMRCKGSVFTASNVIFAISCTADDNSSIPNIATQIFSGEKSIPTSGTVIPLNTELMCDYRAVGDVLHYMHSQLKSENDKSA